MSLLLEVENLHVCFDIYEGTAKVLDGIILKVRKGEKVGLVGETGCGKSISMKAIMGILPIPPAKITKGRILLQGRDILKMSQRELQAIKGKEISMIFQDPVTSLNPVFTIGDQLMEILRWSKNSTKSKGFRKKRVLDVLRAVKLPDPERIMESYPIQLSGGMCQRVLIAMALLNEPKLLIADEPGTALDVTIQAQILKLLDELVSKRKISLLLITHNLGVIREITDRVYVMYAGQIVEMAKTEVLFSKPKHPYTKGLLASVPKLTGEGMAEGIKGMIPDYIDPPQGCRFHPRCEHKMAICTTTPPLFEVDEGHKVVCFLYQR
jgi:peptide/nickel transport system ATP-binding protein